MKHKMHDSCIQCLMSAIDLVLCLLTHAITDFHMFIHFSYLILVTLKASLHHTDDPFRLLASALPSYKAISPSLAYHSLFYFISIQQLLFHICLKSLFVNGWPYIPSSQSSFKTTVTAVIPSALFSMYVCGGWSACVPAVSKELYVHI